MMIETVNKTYLVIGFLEHDERRDVYLCENTEDRRRSLIIRLNDQRLVAGTMKFLYGQVESETFTDLTECFVFEERLHLTFRYHQGEALVDKLSGEYTGLQERLEIAGRLTEKMVLLSMPCYFQCGCLRPQNIRVSRSLDVSFAYSVDGLERFAAYTMRDVQEELVRVMELLFREELKKEVVGPIKDFMDFLRRETCADYLEIHSRWLTARGQAAALSQEELALPRTWIFRVWDRIRMLFTPMKRLAVIVILVFGLGYLIWTVRDAAGPAAPAVIMTQIGTEQV